MPPAPSSQTFGKYTLLERIASGGMAEVWRATAETAANVRKVVAIKRILPEHSADPTFVRMFVREAEVAINLSHANLVQIYDLGKEGGHWFIALEYVEGKDLRALLGGASAKGRGLPPGLAAWIAREICAGLDYAHTKVGMDGRPLGIVHRDISPANVLLSWEGQVKVADFGIARRREVPQGDELSRMGDLKGKPSYMSPEQSRGELDLDGRSDVFAVGIVLYECLTGSRPFEGSSDRSVLRTVQSETPPAPSSLASHVPRELDRIVLAALAKVREDRPSAGELRDMLEAFLRGSPGKPPGEKELARLLAELTGGRPVTPVTVEVKEKTLALPSEASIASLPGKDGTTEVFVPSDGGGSRTEIRERPPPAVIELTRRTLRPSRALPGWLPLAAVGLLVALLGALLGPSLFKPETNPSTTPSVLAVASTSREIPPTIERPAATPRPTPRPLPPEPGEIRVGSLEDHHFRVKIAVLMTGYQTTFSPFAVQAPPGTYGAEVEDIETGTRHIRIKVRSGQVTKVLLPHFVTEGETYGP